MTPKFNYRLDLIDIEHLEELYTTAYDAYELAYDVSDHRSVSKYYILSAALSDLRGKVIAHEMDQRHS